MSDFNTSKEIYDYIMSRPLPEQFSVPAGIQTAYKGAVQAGQVYAPQINTALNQYGAYTQVPKNKTYKNLVDMYNREYQKNAVVAAKEAVKASAGNNAGYGDTYSKAASTQALSGYLANKGAAVPSLMSAAAQAVAANQDARAAGINAMTNQRSANMKVGQQAYSDKVGDWNKGLQARQQAYNTLLNSLNDLYAYQYALENPTSSGSSGGGRRSGRKYSSGGSGGDDDGIIDDDNKQKENTGNERQDAWTIYDNAIKYYPALKGKLSPPGHNRDSGMYMSDYATYVDEQIKQLLSNSTDSAKKKKAKIINDSNLLLQQIRKLKK